MYISIYNLFYTSLPVLAVGIFDQDVNDKNSVLYPQLYKPGHCNLFFNKKEFLLSALQGCYISIVLFFIPFGEFHLKSYFRGLLTEVRFSGTYYDAVSSSGQGLSDYMLLCSVVATILVIVNTAQVCIYIYVYIS